MLSRLTFSRWVLLPLLAFPANAQLPATGTQNAEAPGVQGPAPIGELFASQPGAASAALPAGSGMAVLSGSQLSAGIAPATLKLVRGGEVRLCPRTGLTVNRGGPGLMLGMGAGAIEIDYRVDKSSADLLVTPDFNVRLAGPGVYHWAVGVTSKGDTCFKPLRGNTSGIVVSELLGSDSYGLIADERADFPGGKLANHSSLDGECGCPPPPPTMVAAADPADTKPTQPPVVPSHDVTAPLPPQRPGETHVEVETPFVFSARAAGGTRPNIVAKLRFSSLPNVVFLQEEVEPDVLIETPAEVSKKEAKPATEPASDPNGQKDEAKKDKKGFAGRVKGFFGSIFRR
jgi:hypothetical protein